MGWLNLFGGDSESSSSSASYSSTVNTQETTSDSYNSTVSKVFNLDNVGNTIIGAPAATMEGTGTDGILPSASSVPSWALWAGGGLLGLFLVILLLKR